MAASEPRYEKIGVHNLIIDDSIQCRVKTDLDWASELSAFFLQGSECPPIDVFEVPDGRLFVTSGFQRYAGWCKALEAKPNLGDIPCRIFRGSIEEAVAFSCGSNRGNGKKPMGPRDITKAVEMLLWIEAWRNRAATVIARHVGCGENKVSVIRARMREKYGWETPETAEGSNGRTINRPSRTDRGEFRVTRMKYGYRSKVGGKYLYSKTREGIDAKATELLLSAASKKESFKREAIRHRLDRLGFATVCASPASFPGVRGHWKPGIVCLPCDFSNHETLPLIVGQLIAARRCKSDDDARMIILCYPEDGPAKVIDLYRQEGIEFLTPDELVERIKADEAKGDAALNEAV